MKNKYKIGCVKGEDINYKWNIEADYFVINVHSILFYDNGISSSELIASFPNTFVVIKEL